MKKVAIVGSDRFGGEVKVTQALVNFLRSKNYDVCYFSDLPPIGKLREYFYEIRGIGKRIITGTYEGDPYIKDLASHIRLNNYVATIAVASEDILLHDLNCIKIFFCRGPTPNETYFKLAWEAKCDLSKINQDWFDIIETSTNKRLEAFETSDYVTFAWHTYEEYHRRYIYDGPNILSNPFGGWSGCETHSKRAAFRFPPAIQYLGGLERYYNNMELLSQLTKSIPYVLDVYGSPQPARKYKLRYMGTMPHVESTLTKYQFGLNTVTSEILRRNGFSSKIFTYLSYGLPCLFNDWEEFPKELNGCVPYNEENFCNVIESFFEKSAWEDLSNEAYNQAHDLRWEKMLSPLLDIL